VWLNIASHDFTILSAIVLFRETLQHTRGEEQVQGIARGEKSVNTEEFKALVKNLIPTNLKQAEWICNEVERLTHEHPELKEKLTEWSKMPESERRELAEFFAHILAQARKG